MVGDKRKQIIGKCTGLNTVADPFQPSNNYDRYGRPILETDLVRAINIVVSDSDKIELAPGFTTLQALTAGHSLFCDGGACLVHDGGSMFEVAADLSLSAAKRTGMSGARVDHAQYGEAIYYGNRQENGVYYQGSSVSWAVDTYTGPPTDRYFETGVPLFDHIATFNGYLLGSIDNALFASEPGSPGLWEMKPVWMSASKILMIKPIVSDGLQPAGGVFVSDEKNQFFLPGLIPAEFPETKVANYPAVEWAVAHGYADASEFSEASGMAAIWLSRKGLSVGMPSGQMMNITEKKIKLPNIGTQGACLIDGSNIISTLR